jgi:hypothetical protein
MKLRNVLCSALLAIPALAAALPVERNDYPDTVVLQGKTVKLIGAGLRVKWIFDVYMMGAYSESGSCDTSVIIGKDESKYLKINMLRKVTADKMIKTMSESFDDRLARKPNTALREQCNRFLSYFKEDLPKGVVLECAYVPGEGVTMKQNGRVLGPAIPGDGFMKVVWDIYFGSDTCCKGLKKQILKTCAER